MLLDLLKIRMVEWGMRGWDIFELIPDSHTHTLSPARGDTPVKIPLQLVNLGESHHTIIRLALLPNRRQLVWSRVHPSEQIKVKLVKDLRSIWKG